MLISLIYLTLNHEITVLTSRDLVVIHTRRPTFHPALERRVHLADLKDEREREGGREGGREGWRKGEYLVEL